MTTLSLIHPKLNRELKVFFVPKNPESKSKRYIPVGVYQLHKYVGEYTANKAVRAAINKNLTKYTRKLQNGNRIVFYSK